MPAITKEMDRMPGKKEKRLKKAALKEMAEIRAGTYRAPPQEFMVEVDINRTITRVPVVRHGHGLSVGALCDAVAAHLYDTDPAHDNPNIWATVQFTTDPAPGAPEIAYYRFDEGVETLLLGLVDGTVTPHED